MVEYVTGFSEKRTQDMTFDMLRNIPSAKRAPSYIAENWDVSLEYGKSRFWIGMEDSVRSDVVLELVDKFEKASGKKLPSNLFGSYDKQFDPAKFLYQPVIDFLAKEIEINPSLVEELNLDVEGEVDRRFKEIGERYKSITGAGTGWGKWASTAGLITGAMIDPAILAGSVLGSVALIGRGMSFARALTIEGVLGAGIETVATPSIVKQMQRGGERFTAEDAVLNIALAGVASSGFYAALRGGGKGLSILRNKLDGVDAPTRALVDHLERFRAEAVDAPFEIRTRGDALEHLDNIDRTTAALVEGRLLPQIEVDISKVRYNPLLRTKKQIDELASFIDDPKLRADMREVMTVLDKAMRIEMRAKEVLAEKTNTALKALDAVIPADKQEVSLLGRITTLSNLLSRLKDEEVRGLIGISRHIRDDADRVAVRRLQKELKVTPSQKQKNILEEKLFNILRQHENEIENSIKARISNLESELEIARASTRYKAEIQEANEVRPTKERMERFQNLSQKLEDGTLGDAELPQFRYDLTPYRNELAQMAKNAQVDIEMFLKNLKDTVKAAEASARLSATVSPDTTIRIQNKTVSMKQAIKNIDEELDFIAAFKECRGG